MLKPTEPAKLLTAEWLDQTALPPLDWLVEPLVVHGDKVIAAGESRAMKTWILLHMQLHIAAGMDWLGFKIPKARKCLYVDEEMNQRTLIRRVKRLAIGAGIPLREIDFSCLSQQGWLVSEHGAKHLLSSLKLADFDPDVIFAEALVRVMPGDENAAADVSKFWRHVTPLVERGKTVLFSHHLTKPSDQPGVPKKTADHRTRGSGDILAGCDSHFSLSRKWPETQTVLEFWKSREGEEHPSFCVWVRSVYPDGTPCGHQACDHPVKISSVLHASAPTAQPQQTLPKPKPQGGGLFQTTAPIPT